MDTAILRVNKAVYAPAKGYLHHSISWIRLDLSWHGLLVDPKSIRIPYIVIEHKKPKKTISEVYGGDGRCRPVEQDVPPGRIHVRITFPPATNMTQKCIKRVCLNSQRQPYMRLLVLEANLKMFLAYIRTNDLAYCDRNPRLKEPLESLQMAIDYYGASFDIRITQDQQITKYKHLVDEFKMFSGPYHECTILGHEDQAHASHVVDSIRLSRWISNGQFKIVEHRSKTELEGVAHILYLKCRGDELLRDGRYVNACSCYRDTQNFELAWRAHNPEPTTAPFWTATSTILQAFHISIAINFAIAYVATGLTGRVLHYRGADMFRWLNELHDFVRGQGFTRSHRYPQIKMLASIYELLAKPKTYPLLFFSRMEHICCAWSTYHHDACDCAETPCRISRMIRRFFNVIKSMSEDKTLSDVPEFGQLRQLAKEFKLQPMKWAIHETLFPEGLRARLEFMPRAHVEKGEVVMDSEAFLAHIPIFNKPTEDDMVTIEAGVRYLI
ncbi:hypothetical protein PTMSG1_06302 [Pyrenophora teres f. maculata]|nr:hypothetical protein PTMSG1_06302 [Pyrenophora teres f. maculata]